MVWIMQDGVVRKVVGNDVEQFRENTGACISCTSTYYQKVYHVLSWRIVLRVVVVTKTTESVLVSDPGFALAELGNIWSKNLGQKGLKMQYFNPLKPGVWKRLVPPLQVNEGVM